MELLGFHLQMKTTWPAAPVRWKPDGRSQEGALGSLEQRPSIMSSPAFTCHLLRCPCSSRVQGFPLRPWPSEKR